MKANKPTIAELDEALHSLNDRSPIDQRLAVVRQVVEYWHRPLRSNDGCTDEELCGTNLPMSLRWWFKTAGHRESVISGQNFLQTPGDMKLDDEGRLLFYVENQGVYLWSTTLEGDDPPVWGCFNETHVPWSKEGMTVSEFLMGACLFQAIMDAPFGASMAWAEQGTLDRIAEVIHPLPLVPWRWPLYPSRFYARNGAFMFAAPNSDNQGNMAFSIWIGAKAKEPLAFLKQIVDDTWEHVAL
jgi:hypothetical protein